MAQSVKISGLEHLRKDLEELSEELPKMRQEIHEELAGQMLAAVQDALAQKAGSSSGTVAGWQESYVGTKGGYAAVRPAPGKFRKTEKSPREYAYGQITNAIENGHAIRRPSGRWRHYRARVKKRYVLGLHFYQQVQGNRLEKLALDAANRLADRIEKSLGR